MKDSLFKLGRPLERPLIRLLLRPAGNDYRPSSAPRWPGSVKEITSISEHIGDRRALRPMSDN